MKTLPIRLLPVLLAASLLTGNQARAQHYGTTWDGGADGTWNATNANWDGTNVYFNSNNRTDDAAPVFSSGGGTVTVDDSQSSLPITTGLILFENAGNWTLQGDPIDSISTDYQAIVVQVESGAGNVTINNTINIAPNPSNGGSYIGNFSTGTTLTLGNLNISNIPQSGNDGTGAAYTNESAPFSYNTGSQIYTVNSQTPVLEATNGATIVINGNITTDPNLYAGLLIGNYGDSSMETGTYIFKGGLDYTRSGGKQFDFGSGNIIFDTSDTGTGVMVFVGAGANLPQTLLTEGNQTISNAIENQGASNAIIGSVDADVSAPTVSTYSGFNNAGAGGGELDLRTGANSTVYYTGQIDGDNNATSKDGAGTAVITYNNTYTSHNSDVFEAKAGTTLIENSGNSGGGAGTGDAFGNGAATNGTIPTSVFVQVDAGATLGGTGFTSKQIMMMGATSVLSAGLAGETGDTLTLAGGVSAVTGLTMNFTIDSQGGANSLYLGEGNFILGNTVTINIATVDGGVNTADTYTLALGSGAGGWDDSGVTKFNFVGPAGYEVSSYNFGLDPADNYALNDLTVQFTATPEPSTYVMMGLGLLALAGIRRWMRLSR
jgi:hypothetical protein